MAGSGIKVTDDIKNMFEAINERYKQKSPKDPKGPLRYAIFKFNDQNNEIIAVEAVEPEGAMSYSEVIETLPSNDVRYLAYDYQYMNKQNMPNRKVILISWAPEGSTIKRKMLAASTLNTLKSSFGVSKDYIEASEASEVVEELVAEKLGGTVMPK